MRERLSSFLDVAPGRILGFWLVLFVLLGAAALRSTSFGIPDCDAISYLQIARHYLAGNLGLAINAYWGPGVSMLMVPLLKLVGDPLLVLRLVCLLGGLLQLVAGWALGWTLGLRGPWLFLGVGLLWARSLSHAFFVTMETADAFLAGLVMLIFALGASQDFPCSRTKIRLVGLLGGLAYLFKAYAFPFTLSYLPLVLWLRRRELDPQPDPDPQRDPGLLEGLGRVLRASLQGWAAFAVVAVPWILILSLHYQRPIFSSSGAINHAIFAPGWPQEHHSVETGVYPVEPGRLSAWEDPTDHSYNFWSPVASWENFRHQARLVLLGLIACLFHWKNQDFLGVRILALAATVVLLLGGWAARRRGRESAAEDPHAAWFLATIALYHAGYTPVIGITERYFLATISLGTLWAVRMAASVADRQEDTRKTKVGVALAMVLVVSMGWPAWEDLRDRWAAPMSPIEAVYRDLRQRGLAAPTASTEWADISACIYLEQPFLGRPRSRSPQGLRSELGAAGVGLFFAWGQLGYVDQLEAEGFLQLVDRIEVLPQRLLRRYQRGPDGLFPSRLSVYRVVPGAPAGRAPVRDQDRREPLRTSSTAR